MVKAVQKEGDLEASHFRKILVPYDIAIPANNAIKQAIKLAAKEKNTEIIVLHVVEIPLSPILQLAIASRKKNAQHAAVQGYAERISDFMTEYAKEVLQEKVKTFQSLEIPIKIKILRGRPGAKIIEYANSEQVDLIVIENTRLGIISKIAAMGSTSRYVAERASCPVMIIR